MNIFKIIIGFTLILCSIGIINADGEVIEGDTIYIDNEDVFMSATPATLSESGYVTFVVETKKYSGDIDLIWGFNKANAKVKTIKYENQERRNLSNPRTRITNGEQPNFKPENKLINGKHLLYTDERQRIRSNNKVEVDIWINISFNSKGKYDFVVKPSYLTIDEAINKGELYILDPWYDNTFYYMNPVCINNTGGIVHTDYQVNLNFSYIPGMQANFSDLRFTEDNVLIPYWVENYNTSDWCDVWIKVGNIDYNQWDNESVRMYYGKPSATTLSDNTSTFIQSHLYSDAFFHLSQIQLPPCVFEAKIHTANSAIYTRVGIADSSYGIGDDAWININNVNQLSAYTSNGGSSTNSVVAGVYFPDAVYKIDVSTVAGKFYINDILKTTILTTLPSGDYLGIRYGTPSSGSYMNWSFIRKWSATNPTSCLGVQDDLFLNHDNDSVIINTVYANGTLISTGGNSTKWYAKALSNPTNITISSYVNGIGVFEIVDNSLQMFGVSQFNSGDIIHLYQESVFSQSGVVGTDGKYEFIAHLSQGSYSISIKSYDNITGIHGFVYEGSTVNQIPLNQVVIYIYNNTWSDTTTTDAGGYYTFFNLTNTTYTLSYKKDRYEEVLYQYVTPKNTSMYYKNIFMQKSTGSFYSRHYCTFILKNIYGKKYSDVNAIVYRNDVVEASGTTGYDGGVVFHLFEDVEYRLTFISDIQNINEEITVTPRDDKYIIPIGYFGVAPTNDSRLENVNYWWTKEEINLTASWLNFSYKNSDNKTTFIEYWINDTNNTNLFYTSQVYPCSSGIYTSNNVVNSSNNTYVVHFSAHHPDYPGLQNSVVQTFSFYTGVLIDLLFSEQWQYTVLSLVIIMLIGTLFGATNAPKGSLIMVLCAWFFSFINWLPTSTVGYGAIVLATIISVGWNLRKSDVVHV